MTELAALWLEGTVVGQALRFDLPLGEAVVGRSADCIVLLNDASVSRRHASLQRDADGLTVADLGSRNGTFIDGSRLPPNTRMPVAAGSEVRFGAVRLRLADGRPISEGRSLMGSLASAQHNLHTSARVSWDELTSGRTKPADLFRVLSDAGRLLVEPLPLEQVFSQALELISNVAPPARRVLLLTLEARDGAASSRTSAQDVNLDDLRVRAGRPDMAATTGLMLSQSLLRSVLAERTALLVGDAQTDPRFRDQMSIVAQGVHSAMVAPLFDNEHVIGAVYADTTDLLQRFTQDQLRAFTFLANLIAVKITNTRLLQAEQEQQRMANELRTAARIQETLLPASLPDFPGYEIHAQQIPCLECAGDLYDAARVGSGDLVFTVGDVSGKGIGAALLMSHTVASLRVLRDEGLEPRVVVDRLHRQVEAASRAQDFVTLFHATLDGSEHRLTYVNAGHNPPVLLTPSGDPTELEALTYAVGLPLPFRAKQRTVELPVGSLLCIYTDGLTEASRPRRDDDPSTEEDDEDGPNPKVMYGERRLVASLTRHASLPLDQLAAALQRDLTEFLGESTVDDDITLFLLRRVS